MLGRVYAMRKKLYSKPSLGNHFTTTSLILFFSKLRLNRYSFEGRPKNALVRIELQSRLRFMAAMYPVLTSHFTATRNALTISATERNSELFYDCDKLGSGDKLIMAPQG